MILFAKIRCNRRPNNWYWNDFSLIFANNQGTGEYIFVLKMIALATRLLCCVFQIEFLLYHLDNETLSVMRILIVISLRLRDPEDFYGVKKPLSVCVDIPTRILFWFYWNGFWLFDQPLPRFDNMGQWMVWLVDLSFLFSLSNSIYHHLDHMVEKLLKYHSLSHIVKPGQGLVK